MLLLVNPLYTDNFLANGKTSILSPQRPAIVVNISFELPIQHIVKEGTDINGFIIHDYTVSVLSFQVRNTKCGGNLCDRQQVYIGKCACYQMHNCSGNVVISIEVQITIPGGSTFKTLIRSKWFSEKFILTGELPSVTRASILENYRIGDRIYTSFESVTRYINELCKFRVIGCGKRGEVQYQGVDQTSNGIPHNAARVMV